MIEPLSLAQLLATDPIAPVHRAIVDTITALMPGVSIVKHPGKVDISELVNKSAVQAPGIGIGWSRIRQVNLADGSYSFAVEWVAYIVAEVKPVAGRRVEKEEVAMAIGSRLLAILSDPGTAFWGRTGILPFEDKPGPELKPLFTVRDASQGAAYYTVTWTQHIADLGPGVFSAATGSANLDAGAIDYAQGANIRDMAPWLPAEVVDGDA